MPHSPLIKQNDALLRMVAQLRNHIDVHRSITVNGRRLSESSLPGSAFFGYLQQSAVEAIAIYICKVYEPKSRRHKLNSIPSIIDSLGDATSFSNCGPQLQAFGRKYGQDGNLGAAPEYLEKALESFLKSHEESYDRIRVFRNKIGAHSEADIFMNSQPSHVVFEAFFSFAYNFYKLIRCALNDAGPANVNAAVNASFILLIRAAGVVNPSIRFKD